MTTFKVSLTASEGEVEAIVALFMEVLDPPPAVSISERGALQLLEAYFAERPDLDALAALTGSRAAASFEFQEIGEENWVALVQRDLHPVAAGRFLVHGSHDRTAGAGRRYAIEIDAGRAFGTAHHGTTRGCLLAIDRIAKRSQWRRVLDLGTGSGVLAIAAAKASTARVLASDIDPVAVAVARENIRQNGALRAIRTAVAVGVDQADIRSRAPFDLIVANILAAPLIRLAPRLTKLVAPGGHIVLSGLLDTQAREVSATYLRLGFALETRLSLEGWTTLILRRPSRRTAVIRRVA
jgi:ribosomal protein L11 methyltransferase